MGQWPIVNCMEEKLLKLKLLERVTKLTIRSSNKFDIIYFYFNL